MRPPEPKPDTSQLHFEPVSMPFAKKIRRPLAPIVPLYVAAAATPVSDSATVQIRPATFHPFRRPAS